MTNATLDHRATPLPPGSEAPEFELRSTPDQTVSLAEFRGQPVILAFYPEDAYQVYRADEGTSERALYVIDAEGIVRWSYISPVGVNAGGDGSLRAPENVCQEGGA